MSTAIYGCIPWTPDHLRVPDQARCPNGASISPATTLRPVSRAALIVVRPVVYGPGYVDGTSGGRVVGLRYLLMSATFHTVNSAVVLRIEPP